MVLEGQQSERITLRLTKDEIGHWNNALNEVCNGISVANFQAAIGMTRDEAAALLERVHVLEPDRSDVFLLGEALAVRNALTAVLTELDPEEFHSRLGFTVEESRQMRNTLDAIIGQVRLVRSA